MNMKPNESKTCTACIGCVINKTALIQTGHGRKLKCPICDAEYDPDYVDPKTVEKEIEDESELDDLHEFYESQGWIIC